MSQAESFLSKSDEQKVVQAIQEAEKNTSGEIRVHIEKTNIKPPLERAKEVFYLLKMHETELKNGILIYIAYEDKQIAILGDKGIHEVTGDDFWNMETELLIQYFKLKEYVDGISVVVRQIGDKLKEFFPYTKDDKNELTDEISNGNV